MSPVKEVCAARNQVIEAKILRRYGMTVQQFIDKGRKSFTDQVFYDICTRIDGVGLSLAFLLCGFDANHTPHLRVITADEPPQNFDSIAFAAIGTGASAALASLSFAADHHGFGRYSEIPDSLYHLLAAKFMAESATDVGHDTFCISIGKKGTFMIHHLAEKAVRDSWLKQGAPRPARSTLKILRDAIFESPQQFDPDVIERCLKYGSGAEKKIYGMIANAKRRKAKADLVATQSESQTLEGQR